MANYKIVVCCWSKGHETELIMTRRQEESLSKKLNTLQAVCPECRNQALGNQAIFIKEGQTLFNPSKVFKCRHGHISTIGVLSSMLHVRYNFNNEDFFNIEGSLEELKELIDTKEISCHHIRENGRKCDCKLKAIDDYSLTRPPEMLFKTTTRIGDLWDKAGVEPVRNGTYDKQHNYQATKSESANRERLKRMRKRNIPMDKHPGQRIDKATKKDYGRRSKNDINPERLNGPK